MSKKTAIQEPLLLSDTDADPPLPREPKSCWNIENAASAWVHHATLPQGPLGGLLLYLLLESLVQDKKDKNPGLFYFTVTVSLLLGTIMAYFIVRARAKVFTPYVAADSKKIYQTLACSKQQEKIAAKEEKKTYDLDLVPADKKPNTISRCLTLGYNGLLITANLATSANISVVFAGFNLISCDVIQDSLADSGYRSVDIIGDIVASIPIKASFVLSSLSMNLLLFYFVQQFPIITFLDMTRSAWRYCTEDRNIYADRQQLLSILAYCRQQNIKWINGQELEFSCSLEEKELAMLTTVLRKKDLQHFTLERIINELMVISIPKDAEQELKTPLKHYGYAGLSWATAMIGLWNFFYSQQQGLQFLLQLFCDEDIAAEITNRYLDNGGKYLMIFNMGAFYFHIIIFNALNYFNNHREINIDQLLPGKGGCQYWLMRVWSMSIVATLPNVNATLQALSASNISWSSFKGFVLFATSLIGPVIMEIFGINRNYRETALTQLKEQADTDLLKRIKLVERFEECHAVIRQLSADEIQKLIGFAARSPKPARLIQCLSKLSVCCRKPKDSFCINDSAEEKPLWTFPG